MIVSNTKITHGFTLLVIILILFRKLDCKSVNEELY